MDWDDLRLVLAAQRAGSFAGAARRLGLTHSTVLRRLARLERDLGVRLFERLPEGLAPTPAGEALAIRAARVEAEALAAERELTGRDLGLAGVVRITAPDDIAMLLLPPALERLRRIAPELRLEVELSNSLADLTRREADVALRATPRPPEAMVGRRLARIPFAFYAAPDYFAARPMPKGLDQLDGHDLLAPSRSLGGAALERWLGGRDPALRANSFLHLANAARRGLGLAMLPAFIGDADPALRRAFASDTAEEGLWLLTHPDLRRNPRVRAVMEAVAAEIGPRLRSPEGG